jgi:hypothetical protein
MARRPGSDVDTLVREMGDKNLPVKIASLARAMPRWGTVTQCSLKT